MPTEIPKDVPKTLNKKKAFLPYILLAAVFAITVGAGVLIAGQAGKKSANKPGNFPKGVLAINTNKSVYLLNEEVKFSLASLDQKGDTLCNSDLNLTITAPSGKETVLSTKAGQVVSSSSCSEGNNVTNDPDYTASLSTLEEGIYKLKLINIDMGGEIQNEFKVESARKYSLERKGAARINPFKSQRYSMTITITSKDSLNVQVVEQIPEEFEVVWQGPAKVENRRGHKTITWDIDLKAGETKELIYSYKAPEVSPQFYEMGPVKLTKNGKEVFKETRLWQLASGGRL